MAQLKNISLNVGEKQDSPPVNENKPQHEETDCLVVAPGIRYGRLLVVRKSHRTQGYKPFWVCRCVCGVEKEVRVDHLRSHRVVSCGCARIEHGKSKTPEYVTWKSMMHRCYDMKCHGFNHYGGRGISVCARWHDFISFAQDMGKRPKGMSLDRIDNSKGYSLDNCRWATNEQQANNRRKNTILDYQDQHLTVSQWARKKGLKPTALFARLARGWPIEAAILLPKHATWTPFNEENNENSKSIPA